VLPHFRPAAVAKFEEFHAANPPVYRVLSQLAHE
jgi:hypothetical protein